MATNGPRLSQWGRTDERWQSLSIPIRRRIELVNRINAGFALGAVSGYHCLKEVIGAEGFGMDYRDASQRTVLHLAVIYHDVAFFDDLVKRGIDVHARDAAGRTVLHLCADSGAPELLKRCLELEVSPDCHDNLGDTALHLAAKRDLTYERCTYHPRGREEENDEASLETVTRRQARRCEVVQILLQAGARADVSNHLGLTARDVAVKSGNQEALDLFAAHGLPGS